MIIQTVGKVNNTLENIAKGASIIIEGYLLIVTDRIENDDIACVELSTGTTHLIDRKQSVEEIETKIIVYGDSNTLWAERRA